ncbi:amino acid permease [Clostridium botulinum]|nr:amino acid permease [Clostridium botulinum]
MSTSKNHMHGEVKQKKSGVPIYLGIASVWFGAHCGPGVASGKQTAVFYSEFGKWAFITPVIAMLLMGLCIYYSVEYARLAKAKNFRELTDKLFYPYEKVFSAFFEITFIATVLMVVGGCIATGAVVLNEYIGLPISVGTIILVIATILLSMYGANIVRSASTIMTIFIIGCLIAMVVLGLLSPKGNFTGNWDAKSFSDVSPIKAIVMAVVYTGFQSAGNIANAVSVSQGIESRKESRKAAIIGMILNTLLILGIVFLLFAYPDSVKETLPNYFVADKVGSSALLLSYVVMVILAVMSTNVSFSFAVVARYGEKLPMKPGIKRDFVVTLILMILCVVVSALGLDAIVGKGYKYLGYACIFIVVIPIILVGFNKTKNLYKNTSEFKAKEDVKKG